MPIKFTIKRADRAAENVKVGQVVYSLSGSDYGLANDDERMDGIARRSVTKKSDGDYPSFTIPVDDLERAT